MTHHFCEESLGDGVHSPPDLYADPVAGSVFSEPVVTLVLPVEPLQLGPSVEAGDFFLFFYRGFCRFLGQHNDSPTL